MDYYKLLNKNVIKIISVLKKDRLYFNQISELTYIKSKNNLLKNLDLMVKLRILKKNKNKSNTFYSINYDNQFSLILLHLININKLQNLPFERRKTIFEIVSNTKPIMAVLFGSTAKGNFKKDSDIDLLLWYSKREKWIENEIKDISSRYDVHVNQIILQYPNLDSKNDTIRHIFKTGIPITGYIHFYEILSNEILRGY